MNKQTLLILFPLALSCGSSPTTRAPFTTKGASFSKAAALYPMQRCEEINLRETLTANPWELKRKSRPYDDPDGVLSRRDIFVTFTKTSDPKLVSTLYDKREQEGSAPETKTTDEYSCALCGDLIACKDEVATLRFREDKWVDFNAPLALGNNQLYVRSEGFERLFTFAFDPKIQNSGTVTARARALDGEAIIDETWSFAANRFSAGVHGEIKMEMSSDPSRRFVFTMHDNGNWFFRSGVGEEFILPDTLFKP